MNERTNGWASGRPDKVFDVLVGHQQTGGLENGGQLLQQLRVECTSIRPSTFVSTLNYKNFPYKNIFAVIQNPPP